MAHVVHGLVGLRHQGPEASDEATASLGEQSAMASRGRLDALKSTVTPWAVLMCTKEHTKA